MIDFALLFVSISLSTVGSLLDNYTTRTFMRDLGPEFEANKGMREVIVTHGFKRSLLYEAIIFVVLGLFDSLRLYSSFFFFGLIWLIVKALVATYNLQNTIEYRTIGISAFKENRRLHRQAFKNVPSMNMIKYILPRLVEALICFAIYVMLLTIDFPLVTLSRYFVISLVFFFIVMAYYSSRKDC